jgi:hypothetical protein
VQRACLAALLALLVSPAVARAGGVTIESRNLPVVTELAHATVRAPARFDMVGLRWRGTGTVRFRTRAASGRWSAWQTPDDVSPTWTGTADALEYRTSGPVRRLRAFYVWSPVVHRPLRRLATAGSPPIITRTMWGADELLRRNHPRYAPSIRLVIVHHTATSNAYTPDQATAIVRGIDVYHVQTNGWDDIGYNFLIDRFGRVYEGRYGGMTRNVIGAHALGFNRGSVGIAVIGNFMTAKPASAAVQSLEKLIAWRLDLAHVDPTSTLTYLSGGSERWRAGAPVKLRAVSGHRDTGSTSCPGTYLYAQLPTIARVARSIGLPKLFAPVVRGVIGGQVVFSGSLSAALAWTVVVTGPSGKIVAQGSGLGATIAWTWNSAGVPKGRYTWTMSAGSNVLPARGVVGAVPTIPPTPVIEGLSVTPQVVSPNGDGYADQATIAYTLTARASVTVTVTDSTGATVATLFQSQKQSARAISFTWSPDALADGHYSLVVAVQADDGRADTIATAFTVDRILSAVAATPSSVAPGAVLTATFALAAPAQATVTVLGPDGSTLATLFQGPLDGGIYSYAWTATPPEGQDQVSVTAVDPLGTVTQSAPFVVATAPP